MKYSAAEVAKKLGITKDSIRYYEREGLIPNIKRDRSGHRVFSDSDLEWLFFIKCLRDTHMPIRRIKEYISILIGQGGRSIPQRRAMLIEHEMYIAEKIKVYQNVHRLIEKKLEFYDTALSNEDTKAMGCMDYATEWERFKAMLYKDGGEHD